jgi:hypothetical protein
MILTNLAREVRRVAPQYQHVGMGPFNVEMRERFGIRQLRQLVTNAVRETHHQLGSPNSVMSSHLRDMDARPDSAFANDFDDMMGWWVWPEEFSAGEFTATSEYIGQSARPLGPHRVNVEIFRILRKMKEDRTDDERKLLRQFSWHTTKGLHRRRGSIYSLSNRSILSFLCGNRVIEGVRVAPPFEGDGISGAALRNPDPRIQDRFGDDGLEFLAVWAHISYKGGIDYV